MSILDQNIIPPFILVFSLAIVLSFVIRRIALYFGIVDKPGEERKIHSRNIPLLGGTAIFIAFFIGLFLNRDILLMGDLGLGQWAGFFVGGAIIIIGGFLDDKYDIKPGYQIIFPILAIVALIYGGVSIEKITNPLGGLFFLDTWTIQGISIVSSLLIAGWLLAMMYSTKLLDGVDGLVSGIVAIGGIIIFMFTISERYYQGDIAFASILLSAACLGFLILNWHPARIFLGEGGSIFLGYALGTLAIISGGKIAIAFLVMGLPILDLFWTVLRRVSLGKNPFRSADRKHLHHRLLDMGLSQRQTVAAYYFFALFFGLVSLFLQSRGKLLAIMVLFLIMFAVVVSLYFLERKKNANQ